MKQIIVVRKDLEMSPGKLAAQVAHASEMFMLEYIKKNFKRVIKSGLMDDLYYGYSDVQIPKDLFEEWINDEYKKCVLSAKNKSDLLKLRDKAVSNGMEEGKDFYLVYDNCHTELNAEEETGQTLTCIGFLPMKDDVIDKITKRYRLY